MKSCVIGPQPKASSMNLYLRGIHTHDRISFESTNCEILECHGLLVLCYAYLQEMVFIKNPSDQETLSI